MIAGWFKGEKTFAGNGGTPTPGVSKGSVDRYNGKPMLRLLESYVLRAIDALPPEQEAGLEAMSPKLMQLFGGDGTWYSAIATTMKLPANMPELILERWQHNLAIAADNNVELSPQEFAEMFVDTNLT